MDDFKGAADMLIWIAVGFAMGAVFTLAMEGRF